MILSRIVDTMMSGFPHGPESGREGLQKRKIRTILACRAAKKALENAGMDAADVELILVATCTPIHFPEYCLPGTEGNRCLERRWIRFKCSVFGVCICLKHGSGVYKKRKFTKMR